jgi:hypothetical protein
MTNRCLSRLSRYIFTFEYPVVPACSIVLLFLPTAGASSGLAAAGAALCADLPATNADDSDYADEEAAGANDDDLCSDDEAALEAKLRQKAVASTTAGRRKSRGWTAPQEKALEAAVLGAATRLWDSVVQVCVRL